MLQRASCCSGPRTAGDAHIIRNAGGRVSGDALRSLAVSQRLLGTKEVVVIHHTKCGMDGLGEPFCLRTRALHAEQMKFNDSRIMSPHAAVGGAVPPLCLSSAQWRPRCAASSATSAHESGIR